MATTLDALLRIKADVQGKPELQTLAQSVTKLGTTAQASSVDLGKMNIAINRASRESGNTIAGIRAHAAALTTLRERTEIGGKAYIRLGNEIDSVRLKLERLTTVEKQASRTDWKQVVGAGAGSLAMGGGIQGAIGGAAGAAAVSAPAAGALAAGALAVGAGIAGATSAALDEEASIRRVRTLSSDAEGLMLRIRELSAEQGHLTNNTEAGAAAYEILSSGFSKTSDVMAILKASTLGAAGGFTDIKTVADAATSIMNSFGLGADKVTRIVDEMIQTQNDGKIVVSQYAQSIGRLAPTFAVAGLSVEEMNAAISALTAKGAPVETTISGLNQAVKSIIKPTDEAKDAAAALGIEFSAVALESKGLGGFLQDVIVKTKGNSTALGVLFSDIDGFRAVTSLTNDQLKGYNKSLKNMDTLTGQAAKSAKLAVDPVKQFDNAWKDFSSTLGRMVLPALTTTVKALTAIIDLAGKIDLSRVQNPNASLMGGDMQIPAVATGKIPKPVSALQPYTVAGITYDPITGRPIAGVGGRQARMTGSKRPNDPAITALIKGLESPGAGRVEGGKADKPSEAEVNARALLATIRFAEGTLGPKGYGTHFGGSYTPPGGAHPDRVIRAGGYASAAYGAYQFMPDTWRGTGGGSMAPARQDAAALRLIRNRGVDPGQSLTREMIDKLAPEWASFPTLKTGTSYYGQGGKSFSQIQAFYRQQVAKGGGDVGGLDLAAGKDEEKAKADAKRKAEDDAKGLAAARETLYTKQAALRIAQATDPMAKAAAEFEKEKADRMRDYAARLADASTEQARQALIGAQLADIGAAEIAHRQKLTDITAQQLTQERERADLLAESMARMEELNSRSSVGTGFKQGLQGYVDSVGSLRDAVGQLTTDSIGGLENSLNELATTGTTDFKAFAASVLKDTAQLIMRQLVLKTIMSAISSFLTPSTAGMGIGSPRSLGSYAGGGYTGNAPRSGGLDGQGGFLAMLHPQETVTDHMRIGPAIRRGSSAATSYPAIPGIPSGGADGAMDEFGVIGSSGAASPGVSSSSSSSISRFERTDAVITRMVRAANQESAARATAAAAAASGGGTMRLHLETTRINSVDYVTMEQLAAAEARSNRATARQTRALQASPAARRSIGI